MFFHLLLEPSLKDVTRVERKTAKYAVISSSVKKPSQNREKSTNGDYFTIPCKNAKEKVT